MVFVCLDLPFKHISGTTEKFYEFLYSKYFIFLRHIIFSFVMNNVCVFGDKIILIPQYFIRVFCQYLLFYIVDAPDGTADTNTASDATDDHISEDHGDENIEAVIQDSENNNSGMLDSCVHVIDGGSLLHRIPWPSIASYEELCHPYVTYVKRHYGNKTCAIFDGYLHETTKSNTHSRRSKGKMSPAIVFTKDMNLTMNKAMFLNNKENKSRFIELLGTALSDHGTEVIHTPADADSKIVSKSIELAHENDVAVHGEDTDLLIGLLSDAQTESNPIYFLPNSAKKNSAPRVWCIKSIKSVMSPETVETLYFWNSILGCDTSSRVYGMGKGTLFKKWHADSRMIDIARIFTNPDLTHDQIAEAGENALVLMYGGEIGTSLNYLRYVKFNQKVSSATSAINAKSLPPTSAAARQHSYRVHHQIQAWLGNDMDACKWGWCLKDEKLYPVGTTEPPAPKELLSIIR